LEIIAFIVAIFVIWLSLVDGPNLLNLLHKHNMKFKIDLLEARNLLDHKKLYT
jgi:hypothetical protein